MKLNLKIRKESSSFVASTRTFVYGKQQHVQIDSWHTSLFCSLTKRIVSHRPQHVIQRKFKSTLPCGFDKRGSICWRYGLHDCQTLVDMSVCGAWACDEMIGYSLSLRQRLHCGRFWQKMISLLI